MLQYTPAANETERECSVFSEPTSTLHMGLLLYAQGVTDRWQRRQRVKMERCCGRYSYLLQCIIPNPDGRGQGH